MPPSPTPTVKTETIVGKLASEVKLCAIHLSATTTVYFVDLKKRRVLGPSLVLAVLIGVPYSATDITSDTLSHGTFFLLETLALPEDRELWVPAERCFFSRDAAFDFLARYPFPPDSKK